MEPCYKHRALILLYTDSGSMQTQILSVPTLISITHQCFVRERSEDKLLWHTLYGNMSTQKHWTLPQLVIVSSYCGFYHPAHMECPACNYTMCAPCNQLWAPNVTVWGDSWMSTCSHPMRWHSVSYHHVQTYNRVLKEAINQVIITTGPTTVRMTNEELLHYHWHLWFLFIALYQQDMK